MKRKNQSILWLLSLCAVLFVACSDDDNPNELGNAITLNMMNEDNGKTSLGESDVYINRANNFTTSSGYINDLGARSGIGANVGLGLNDIAREVAVVPGHLYQVFDKESILEFPSKKRAVKLGDVYYKVYVESSIMKEGKSVGNVVKYASIEAASNNFSHLPKEETLKPLLWAGDEIAIKLPKDGEYAFDPEYDEDAFNVYQENGQVVIRLLKQQDKTYGPWGDYKLYLRSGDVYTVLNVEVGEY